MRLLQNQEQEFNLWNNALIKDEVGQIKELLCSGIDITERKHSEEALIKVKDEFHLLAESMPQIVWVALRTEYLFKSTMG
jgi:PAS domain-containing protein